jgi:hypothetical protein
VKRSFIERFFRELDRQWGRPAEIILTGAAAGALLGHARPSVDIDFEIRTGKGRDTSLGEVIQRTSQKTGITVNYSEDISHWSMIDFLDYRKTTLPYKMIGKLRIKLMAPEYWTIGKMGRFLDPDVRDLVKIIKKRQLPPNRLIRLWSRALRASPLSLASGQFRDHVIDFLENCGRSAWGKNFEREQGVALFRRLAKIKYLVPREGK